MTRRGKVIALLAAAALLGLTLLPSGGRVQARGPAYDQTDYPAPTVGSSNQQETAYPNPGPTLTEAPYPGPGVTATTPAATPTGPTATPGAETASPSATSGAETTSPSATQKPETPTVTLTPGPDLFKTEDSQLSGSLTTPNGSQTVLPTSKYTPTITATPTVTSTVTQTVTPLATVVAAKAILMGPFSLDWKMLLLGAVLPFVLLSVIYMGITLARAARGEGGP